MKPKERLADNDGHGLFGALGDSVITGPTLTNVNDFRAVLITQQASENDDATPAPREDRGHLGPQARAWR